MILTSFKDGSRLTKRVLLIAYPFSPIANMGSLRPYRLAKKMADAFNRLL